MLRKLLHYNSIIFLRIVIQNPSPVKLMGWALTRLTRLNGSFTNKQQILRYPQLSTVGSANKMRLE